MSTLLRAKGLKKAFGNPTPVAILKGIDLEIEAGETLAIMGASGEGKSTLLHILGTLEAADAGDLFIGGKRVTNGAAPKIRRKTIGFIFQSFFLMEDYTALDNVLMPARIARGLNTEARLRAEALLERVGLGHRLDFPAKLLSGGEKQRVAIARALCNNPDLIMADEPSGNLDHQNSQAIHELLLELVRDEGKTLITVTHDDSLATLCDRRMLLQEGQLTCI